MSIEDYQIYHMEDIRGNIRSETLKARGHRAMWANPITADNEHLWKAAGRIYEIGSTENWTALIIYFLHTKGGKKKKSAERTRWAEDGGGTEYAKLSMNVLIVAHGPRSPKIFFLLANLSRGRDTLYNKSLLGTYGRSSHIF